MTEAASHPIASARSSAVALPSDVASIQYLRGIAALMVVFAHSSEQFLTPSRQTLTILHDAGWAGVDLFFIISGFVMTYNSTPERLHPNFPRWDFFRRRLARIVPFYWIVSAVTALVVCFWPSLFKTTTFSLPNVVASFLFIPWPDLKGKADPILHLGWTLNYEMFFYLWFAIFLPLAPWRRLLNLSWVLVGIAMTIGYFHESDPAFHTSHPVLDFYGNWVTTEFLAGCVLATLYQEGWLERVPILASSALLAVAIALLVACAAYHGGVDAREWWKGLPALVITASILAIERVYPFRSRALHRLGDATYSLYLTHIFVVMGFRKLWLMANFPTTGYVSLSFIAVCLAVATPLGLISYYLPVIGEKAIVTRAKELAKRWPPPSGWLRSHTPRAST